MQKRLSCPRSCPEFIYYARACNSDPGDFQVLLGGAHLLPLGKCPTTRRLRLSGLFQTYFFLPGMQEILATCSVQRQLGGGPSLEGANASPVAAAERGRRCQGQDGKLWRQWFGHQLGESCPRQLFTGVANSSNNRSGTSLEGLPTSRRCLVLYLGSSESASEWRTFKTRS